MLKRLREGGLKWLERWGRIQDLRDLFALLWDVIAWAARLVGAGALLLRAFSVLEDYWVYVFGTIAILITFVPGMVAKLTHSGRNAPTRRTFDVEPDVSRDWIRSRGEMRAFIHVRNAGGNEMIRRCYGRIASLVWVMAYEESGESKSKAWRMFTDRDICFRWQGLADRYHDFHSEALLEIAVARYGEGSGVWATHADTPAPNSVSMFDECFLSLELAAENAPSQIANFRLRIYSRSTKIGNDIYLEPSGTPPHCDFEMVDEAQIPAAEVRPS